MREIPYDRGAAVDYARRWALSRNPAFYDFSDIGGDCTNFVSQCIYAGAGVMNYTKDTGWYYISSSDRTPSWTGVEYLYDFLIIFHHFYDKSYYVIEVQPKTASIKFYSIIGGFLWQT